MRLMDRRGLVALGAGLALTLGACHHPSAASDGAGPMFTNDQGLLSVPESSPLRSHLAVQPVGVGADTGRLDLPAVVEADPARVANVLAPLTGRVVALKVGLGAHVKQGQVLAILSSGDFAQAYADEAKARDALDLANRALVRARGVQDAGGAAIKDLESAQSSYNQAQAEMDRAHTRLLSLNAGQGAGAPGGASHELALKAPQSGVVTSLAVADGAQVSDPTATLITVTNLDRVFVTAQVAEADIGKVAAGAPVDIILTADPGRPLHAKITEVNPVVEPDTRRQKARIAMANADGRLMPNMYATVGVSVSASGGVFVPQSALLMNNDATSVLVEVRPWVFERRVVKIGDETDTATRVLSGLQAGDRVVVRGGVLLND